MSKKKVVLDPGHSIKTPGKRNVPYYEYSSNRRVAAKAKRLLEAHGIEVAYSINTTASADASLSARASAAVKWGADLFVSIHSNAGPASATGTETFVHSNSSASVPVAQAVQSAMVAALGTRNRGVKKANFGVLRGTYKHMLAILTEGEFYSNPTQQKWMLTDDYDERYATGLVKGICAYFRIPYRGTTVPEVAVPPVTAPAEGSFKDMVVVKVNDLFTYESMDWSDKGPVVNEGEAFTVVGTHKVDGGTMYELLSGLYITANTKYVDYQRNAIVSVPDKKPASKPSEVGKRVVAIASKVNYYNTARWTNPSGQFLKGQGWTIQGRVSTNGSDQYRVKNSAGEVFYITARPDLVKVI